MQIYNTLTRQKEELRPLEKNRVKIYSCGPTVYDFPHIGNLRAYLFADTLRRTLEFLGFEVVHVMNITDVGHLVSDEDDGEDKMEKAAKRPYIICKFCGQETPIPVLLGEKAIKTSEWINCAVDCVHCKKENTFNYKRGKGDLSFKEVKIKKRTPWEIARYYEEIFKENLKALNILTPTYLPRATEHIAEQIAMIEKLFENGYAYIIEDGIYFDVSKFKDYGKLSGQKLEEKEAGARIEVKSEKRNPQDFALWKFLVGENAHHLMQWDSPWGRGFPGWHIECSAMGMKYLGETFDIHTGGIDHVPVHHENEIAQSEGATGKKFVNYWMHNDFLRVDGGKMSKSLGNFYKLQDLIDKGFSPLDYRYFCLMAHYRSKLNFTWESLESARSGRRNLFDKSHSLQNARNQAFSKSADYETFLQKFQSALSDDLNTAQALAVLWEVMKDDGLQNAEKADLVEKFDAVLGLDLLKEKKTVEIPADVLELAEKREKMRAEKNWAEADKLRLLIQEKGYEVKDGAGGSEIVKS